MFVLMGSFHSRAGTSGGAAAAGSYSSTAATSGSGHGNGSDVDMLQMKELYSQLAELIDQYPRIKVGVAWLAGCVVLYWV